MTRNVLVSLLRQGATGSEILQILDTISDGNSGDQFAGGGAEPTADPIEF